MSIDWSEIPAAIWRQGKRELRAVRAIDPIRLHELIGIERQKHQLIRNTRRFIAGKPANNALLWGARGTGKSSLIKGKRPKIDLYHLAPNPQILSPIHPYGERHGNSRQIHRAGRVLATASRRLAGIRTIPASLL